jgi:hypothetical protein
MSVKIIVHYNISNEILKGNGLFDTGIEYQLR